MILMQCHIQFTFFTAAKQIIITSEAQPIPMKGLSGIMQVPHPPQRVVVPGI